MSISLKALSDRIDKIGSGSTFYTPDYAKKIGISNGYKVTVVGYVLCNCETSRQRTTTLFINNIQVACMRNNATDSYDTITDVLCPVIPNDIVTYSGAHSSANTWFIPVRSLKLYYSFSYNIIHRAMHLLEKIISQTKEVLAL